MTEYCKVLVETIKAPEPVRLDPMNHAHLPSDPPHEHTPDEELWTMKLPDMRLVCVLPAGHEGNHQTGSFLVAATFTTPKETR